MISQSQVHRSLVRPSPSGWCYRLPVQLPETQIFVAILNLNSGCGRGWADEQRRLTSPHVVGSGVVVRAVLDTKRVERRDARRRYERRTALGRGWCVCFNPFAFASQPIETRVPAQMVSSCAAGPGTAVKKPAIKSISRRKVGVLALSALPFRNRHWQPRPVPQKASQQPCLPD
jgi:hypothetical protein